MATSCACWTDGETPGAAGQSRFATEATQTPRNSRFGGVCAWARAPQRSVRRRSQPEIRIDMQARDMCEMGKRRASSLRKDALRSITASVAALLHQHHLLGDLGGRGQPAGRHRSRGELLALNLVLNVPGARFSFTSVATSRPSTSNTFRLTMPPFGTVNSISVVGLNGLG